MGAPFQPSRDDGRSDRQVIYDLTHEAEPGATYTYSELIVALESGLDSPIPRDRVYRAVGAANKLLLRENGRYLGVVPNVGYRMLLASEYTPAAIRRKARARQQLDRGREILVYTPLGELDAAQRSSHEKQLIILQALCGAVDDLDRRQARSESLIEQLLKSKREMETRLDRLDGGEATSDEESSGGGATP